MTLDELKTVVDTIMGSHLDATFWTGLNATTKGAAVMMARNDIFAELPGMVLAEIPTAGADENPVCIAIAEQAVYLARNYADEAENGGGGAIASESVDGLSITYANGGDPDEFGISPRALKYIGLAKKRSHAAIRFSRG